METCHLSEQTNLARQRGERSSLIFTPGKKNRQINSSPSNGKGVNHQPMFDEAESTCQFWYKRGFSVSVIQHIFMQNLNAEFKQVKKGSLEKKRQIIKPPPKSLRPLKWLILSLSAWKPHPAKRTAGDVMSDVQESIGISNKTNIKTCPRATAVGDTLWNRTHHYPRHPVNQCHVHRDEVTKFNISCSPLEQIHVNVRHRGDWGPEFVYCCLFFPNQKLQNYFLKGADGDEHGSFRENSTHNPVLLAQNQDWKEGGRGLNCRLPNPTQCNWGGTMKEKEKQTS